MDFDIDNYENKNYKIEAIYINAVKIKGLASHLLKLFYWIL